MPCRPPRQRVLVSRSPAVPLSTAPATTSDTATTDAAAAAIDAGGGDADDDVCLPSITTDIDLSDHPLGQSFGPRTINVGYTIRLICWAPPSVAEWLAWWTQAQKAWVQIAAATLF